MKLKVGKYYRTRVGAKVGPAEENTNLLYPFTVPHNGGFYGYTSEGISCIDEMEDDIVAEWDETHPVRIVTRREIVPGEYGIVNVMMTKHGELELGLNFTRPNATDLRSAAAILSQLAEVLEENADKA